MQTGISINNSMMLRGVAMAPGALARQAAGRPDGQWLDVRDVSFYGTRPGLRRETRGSATTSRRRSWPATSRSGRCAFVSVTGSYSFLNFDTQRDLQLFTPRGDAGHRSGSLTYHVTRAAVAYRLADLAGLQHARRLLSRRRSNATRNQRRAVLVHGAGIRGGAAGAAPARTVRAGGSRADDADQHRSAATMCR